MATHIKEFHADGFRGLRDLQLTDLKNVNIILGGNSAGKTSVLEAIELFCAHSDASIITIARQRDKWKGVKRFRLADTEAVRYLFSLSSEEIEPEPSFSLQGWMEKGGAHLLECSYTEETTIFFPDVSEEEEEEEGFAPMPEETSTFYCHVCFSKGEDCLDQFSFPVENNAKKGYAKEHPFFPVTTLHVGEHLTANPFKSLTAKKKTKERAVSLLQLFDPNFVDLRNTPDDARTIPLLEYQGAKEYIPLSLFGDGLKKALTLLEGLERARDGILLIDEYETALHTTVMEPVFQFLLDTAKELNVQLFLTTHSIEAIDKLLECKGHLDQIHILRLDQEDKTYITSYTGEYAKETREKYSQELRI